MYHAPHPIHGFCCWYRKGLLSFVSERIKLAYRINNTRLAIQTSTTTIYRLQASELKFISEFQLLFHWKNFEKHMTFHTLPWRRWNRTRIMKYMHFVPFATTELGQMSWSSIHTKIWTRQQLHHCTHVLESWRYVNVTLQNTKRHKNSEESSAHLWP